MLNSIVFLSKKYFLPGSEWTADFLNSIYPSLVVDFSENQTLNEAYNYYSEHNVQNFSISILAKTNITESFLQQVIPFFFIPSYLIVNNQRILNLAGDDEKINEDLRNKILLFSRSQGIENLMVNCLLTYRKEIDPRIFLENPSNYLFYNTADLEKQYAQLLETSNPYGKIFYLVNQQEDIDIQQLYPIIAGAEDKLKNNNPVAYTLANEISLAKKEMELLKKKYAAAENELNNYKSHMEVLRSSHQAKELQDYYDNEYEILPLWYKRFGHVIKVITGKRSFRSLFNDNVKKYKD